MPDRSLVRNLLREVMDVYLVNWGYPKRGDMFLTWDDYVCEFIDDLNVSFLMASPLTLMFGNYADAIDVLEDRKALLNFLRMERWLVAGTLTLDDQ